MRAMSCAWSPLSGSAADDDVVNLGGVEADAVAKRVQHLREVALGVKVGEPPLPGLPRPRGERTPSMIHASPIRPPVVAHGRRGIRRSLAHWNPNFAAGSF
jgi:hypothetical protein